MIKFKNLMSVLAGGASVMALTSAAWAENFNVPSGDLEGALKTYATQAGVRLVVSDQDVKGRRTRGAKGELTAVAALSRILDGTGFSQHATSSGAIVVARELQHSAREDGAVIDIAQAAPRAAASGIESVVVTSSKIKGDIQTVPIAITALSQEQLTSRQIAGGPDLVKEVPNLTFSKTNFTGYNIEIRGIGTQAISVTTDPAVAVAFNDTPFIRNHFFEQEFYDVSQVEVLRGPQGTLYGRNATAGVVNVVSAKPTDQFEAMLSADWGNYTNRRYEGMVNIPIVSDKLALRVAGEWTKRNGYSFNEETGTPIDGRDLWSSRTTLEWKPGSKFTADLVWEHFQESDDRLRSGKQLCTRNTPPPSILGLPTNVQFGGVAGIGETYLNQICAPGSLYSSAAFGVPDSLALPYYGGLIGAGSGWSIGNPLSGIDVRDAYSGTTQSHDLRVIESALEPQYEANNDTLELNAEWNVTPSLTVNSATGYNHDFLWSTEDFNRFNTQPGIFNEDYTLSPNKIVTPDPLAGTNGIPANSAVFCDPQLGCSDRLVGEDLSEEHSWQLSQELRLTSDFKGPFNFSLGGNYMHYETKENYYVFFNTLTMFSAVDGLGGNGGRQWYPGISDNASCLSDGYEIANPHKPSNAESCLGYIDPNPLNSVNGEGHNYFLSQNPYILNSYAFFGETYYNINKDVKLTAGLRWTDDKKHFIEIPSELLTQGYGYPSTGALDQEWKKWTGRFVADWTPKLAFTDQSMFYASYAHGYKAGGANPPGAVLLHHQSGDISNPTHPLTFAPEYNDAFELGTKNTALDGALTFNGDVFYYNYKGYQISQIVDRTSVNLNFDATVRGAEIQATWEAMPGLKFGFAGGYEHTRIADGSQAIDLMDRTAGNLNWVLVKPFVTQASNCVLPAYLVAYMLNPAFGSNNNPNIAEIPNLCADAYGLGIDPVTGKTYVANPTGSTPFGLLSTPIDPSYHGFDPFAGTAGDPYTGQNNYNGIDYGPVPNGGAGFYKDVSGKQLPNAPHFTVSLNADYTMPISADWAATLHSDFYWQSQSSARVFNDNPYDKIRGYSNVNLALILNDASGWQVMGYVKNVFDTTAITGTFLNSDDTGLTTNIFTTDPRLYGVRVTKNFDGGDGDFDLFSGADGKLPQIWLTLGGNYNAALSANSDPYNPDYIRPGGASLVTPVRSGLTGVTPPGTETMTQLMNDAGFPAPSTYEKSSNSGLDWDGKLAFQPDGSDWVLKASIRYGRSGKSDGVQQSEIPGTRTMEKLGGRFPIKCTSPALATGGVYCVHGQHHKNVTAFSNESEQHTIMDFEAGVNVGLGLFGHDGTGNISGGLRMAQFKSLGGLEINSVPEYFFANSGQYRNIYESRSNEERGFHGAGPELSWDANQTLLGNATDGEVTVDWGANAAVLFGRQSANTHHFTSYCHLNGSNGGVYGCPTGTHVLAKNRQTKTVVRSRRVNVPNLGGYIGASYRYSNARFSLGYRADTFFNAMDGGQATAKSYNRGFYGPFMNVSIGFGG